MAKILIVDDDTLITFALGEVLGIDGHEVITENDSSKVLDVALRETPDIICLDLMMPQPDGFKLTRMIRQQSVLFEVPILIVTALGDTDSKIVAIEAGATDYLAKPFRHREFSERIKDLLRGKELGLFGPD